MKCIGSLRLSLLAILGLMELSALAQTAEINVKVVQQRFCVASGVRKSKASIQINVPAGNCDVEQMEIDWSDGTANEIFRVNIPNSARDTSFIREHDFELTNCLDDRRFNVLLTSTFKANCNKPPVFSPGIILFTNLPEPTLRLARSPVCINQPATFDLAFCPSQNITYTLDYGDGTSGTALTHPYSATGTYTARVRATNVCNANGPPVERTVSVPVIDKAIPKIGPDSGRVVAVRADSAFICFDGGGIIRLDGIGSINASAYDWDITPAVEYLERTTENSANPKVRFVKPGIYTISLRVNNACNQWSPRISCIHVVEDLPVLTLDQPPAVCADVRYRPTPFNPRARYSINGRPLPASGDTLLQVDNTPYTVVVEGRLDNLCGNVPKSVSFTVGRAQAAIILTPAGQDTVLCVGTPSLRLRTNFTDGAWAPSPVLISEFVSTTLSGTYALTYTRGVGTCLRAASVTVRVVGVAVVADNKDACRGESVVRLTGSPAGGLWSTSINCSNCIQGDTLLLSRLTASQTTIPLVYRVLGTSGCSASTTAAVTIGQPVASFSLTGGCSGRGVVPTNLSTGASVFQWLVNGNEVATTATPSLSLLPGFSQVTLVASSGSCSTTASQTVQTLPTPQPLTITPSAASGCAPLTVNFTLSRPEQASAAYAWNFGNATSSNTYQPSPRSFANTSRQPQSYTVVLRGSNSCDNFSATTTLTVLPNAQAEIGVDSTMLRCPPALVQFSNRSTGWQGNANWNFGDGSPPLSTTVGVVSHTYASPQIQQVYTVRLSVSGSCKGSIDSVQITVLPNSTTLLTGITPARLCPGEPITFRDASTPKPARVQWLIDGQLFDGYQVRYPGFGQPGTTYTVRQTVFPECGGVLTRDLTIRTDTIPTGRFDVPDRVCKGQPVSIENRSNPAYRFRWNFGDGSPVDSTFYSPTHTFATGGRTYTISMTVVGFPVTCTSVVSRPLDVRQESKAQFDVRLNGVVCSDTLVLLTDQSEHATAWRWYANGVLRSTDQNPQIKLPKGRYDIKLRVSNNGICPDSTVKQDAIEVDTCTLYAAENFTPNSDNIGDFFNLYGSRVAVIRELRIFSRWGYSGLCRREFNSQPPNRRLGWAASGQTASQRELRV